MKPYLLYLSLFLLSFISKASFDSTLFLNQMVGFTPSYSLKESRNFLKSSENIFPNRTKYLLAQHRLDIGVGYGVGFIGLVSRDSDVGHGAVVSIQPSIAYEARISLGVRLEAAFLSSYYSDFYRFGATYSFGPTFEYLFCSDMRTRMYRKNFFYLGLYGGFSYTDKAEINSLGRGFEKLQGSTLGIGFSPSIGFKGPRYKAAIEINFGGSTELETNYVAFKLSYNLFNPEKLYY